MPEHTKMPGINNPVIITIQDKSPMSFLIPRHVMPKLIELLNSFQNSEDNEETLPIADVFKDLYAKYGKIGSTIRGCRARDNMTQTELAQKLNIHQSHISQMEHGKRTIGKKMAHKLAKIFNSDYRLFL